MFGSSIISVLSNALHIKYFKISDIFWIFDVEVFGNMIFYIKHNSKT